MYVYFSLLLADNGLCHPTTKQIREDLGVSSLTIVFDAISVLEDLGFILRSRQNIVELKSRRNVYQRPSCEFTILRLLKRSKIDGLLRPSPGSTHEMSEASRKIRDEWLRNSLGDSFEEYRRANAETKTDILIRALRAKMATALPPSEILSI